ncbi:exodeoxyribonuclease VII large subunit [Pararhodobacter sp. SW119]|uniref:exodeoxyribonuclease VII large subunit n=1 Tax=Pararhodobacter sp. SW119 TaxID=2780075 RepID=UPI001ADFFA33|nr:exodeoxyribonuclease VII large subunit [Pararhodobacter sp. SW119]
MDLLEDPAPSNAHDFTVSELSGAVKRVIEGEFGRVRVRGEVGRVVIARTGHMYFDLKDDRAVIACVSWKGQVARMTVRPEEGMEVIATGRVTTFAPQSKYQLQVENIEPAGAGALMAMLEARKKALAAEGLFDPARKRPIPYLPGVIGVISSPTGAVIRDILHRLADRFPRHVILWPVAVQGERCPADVVRAIRGFNALGPDGPVLRPDVLIVARGGGSIEDLWGFNDEAVVRAAAESAIPLISAVGHETDTTLIDFAADRRAPTPTAAAEMAVPVRAELLAQVAALGARLDRGGKAAVQNRGQRLRDVARALPRPEALLSTANQRFDLAAGRFAGSLRALADRKRLDLSRAASGLRPGTLTAGLRAATEALRRSAARLVPGLQRGVEQRARELAALRLSPARLRVEIARVRPALDTLTRRGDTAMALRFSRAGDRLEALDRMRQTLGYRETLARGFAILRDGDGAPVTSAAVARVLPQFTVELGDGAFDAAALAPSGAPKRGPKPAKPPEQGSLF